MTVEIRRGSARFVERAEGRVTRHSFSFGAAYDPENLRFGPMVCHDDHLLASDRGFDTHRHSDLDIVTWVVSGALRHRDGDAEVVIEPGQLAHLRAGDGVDHSEVAVAPQTRFVQVWLAADDAERAPSYSTSTPQLVAGELVEVLRPQPSARLSVARLDAGDALTLPAAALLHVYVARGALLRSSLAEPLADGDAFRFADEPTHEVTAAVPSELLVWEFGPAGRPGDESAATAPPRHR